MLKPWMMANHRTWVSLVVVISGSCLGCVDGSQSVTGTVAKLPKVVATNSVLCDLTQQVAQNTVALSCLLAPGQDPHTYSATPSDRVAIAEADLVLYGGYNLIPEIEQMIETSQDGASKVAVYEAAVMDPLMGKEHDHHDHENESNEHPDQDDHGDDHENESHDDDHENENNEHSDQDDHHGEAEEVVVDPHVWHRASNNGAIVDVIAAQLAQINPEEAYDGRANALKQQFSSLDSWMTTQVATIPPEHRTLVTTHDAFGYFADAYGVEVKAILSGMSTEEKPSAARLADLVDQIKATQVSAIFAETSTNPKLMASLAQGAEVTLVEQPLYVEGPGADGSEVETMQAMLVWNTCTVVNALGGTCEPESALP